MNVKNTLEYDVSNVKSCDFFEIIHLSFKELKVENTFPLIKSYIFNMSGANYGVVARSCGADLSDSLIGFAFAHKANHDDTAYLSYIACNKSYRNNYVASNLLLELALQMSSDGLNCLKLNSFQNSTRFYESLGFNNDCSNHYTISISDLIENITMRLNK